MAVVALTACGAGHPAARPPTSSSIPDTYGSLPSFLPTGGDGADSELQGTVTSPAVTSQGDSVEVRSGNTIAHAVVTGPEVPGEGLPYVAESTTCTWTVTLRGATAPVPIVLADFTAIDHLGHVYPMHLAPGRPAPPASLVPGRTVTFALRTVMPTGEGLMRWAPDGRHILASWDFVVEND